MPAEPPAAPFLPQSAPSYFVARTRTALEISELLVHDIMVPEQGIVVHRPY